MPVPDNNIKAGIFPGKVIIVAHGKKSLILEQDYLPNELLAMPTGGGLSFFPGASLSGGSGLGFLGRMGNKSWSLMVWYALI